MKIGIPYVVAALSILGASKHPAVQKAYDTIKEKGLITEDGKYILAGTARQPGVYGKEGQENSGQLFTHCLHKKIRQCIIRIKFLLCDGRDLCAAGKNRNSERSLKRIQNDFIAICS